MRPAVRRVLTTALAALSLAGCYLVHERPRPDRDANAADASSADAPSNDMSLAPDQGPPCDGRGMIWGTQCTPELEAECQRRATMQAFGRPAYSHCFTLENGRQSSCSVGDYCADGACRCTATRYCVPGDDVCVSDTPDGRHYCIPICWRGP